MGNGRETKRRVYKALPLRRIYIPKSNEKKRPLGIPSMKDRGMRVLHAMALLPVSEMTADWNSYGFRPERATTDALSISLMDSLKEIHHNGFWKETLKLVLTKSVTNGYSTIFRWTRKYSVNG